MNSPLAYLNGRLLPFAEAALPLADAGFAFGATVVDNARTFRHKLFRWPDHLARFRRDCQTCYIPLQQSNEQLTATADELISHNASLLPPGGELQLVTFATPGPLALYGTAGSWVAPASNRCETDSTGWKPVSPSKAPTLGMHTYPLPFARYRRFFTEGAVLAAAGFQSSARADALSPTVKHRSRLSWWITEQRLRDPESPFYKPGAVAVMMNGSGPGDTAIGSILSVADDSVIAAEEGSVLESISVRVVAELCADMGIPFRRRPLDPVAENEDAIKEVLLAGTGFCLAGVREFALREESRRYAWPGPIYQKLLAAWSELVGVDIAQQFLDGANANR
ncbi:MAG TPA: aminotransferase class IV [Urbifossiella sp.]|nr:aminotransferase class IV [Urbifossiella sp.]